MAWSHFKVADLLSPSATLATDATLPTDHEELSQASQSVATVLAPTETSASKGSRETVATVATVAGSHALEVGVPPREVAVLFERIVGKIAGPGLRRPEAERLALPVLHSTLANDPRLSSVRHHHYLCASCGEPDKQGGPLLPVLSAGGGQYAWLHAGACHQQYRADHAAKVTACIAAAGINSHQSNAA